jgi:RNA polymerase sigma-70 factor, ECF subfamily
MSADELVAPPPAARTRWLAGASESDWDEVFAEQLPKVYNFFRYRIGPGTEVDDLTSLTFEKAWRARHRYRRDLAGFSTWLLTIARHVATDHLRANRRRHAPLDEGLDVSTGHTPEDAASQDSDLRRLLHLTEQLPDRERELLALKYGADMNNRAIAKLIGLGESNIGTILHRVTETLRSRWHTGEPS